MFNIRKLGRKHAAPASEAAEQAGQESQRVQDLIEDQQHQLDLRLRLLALHEQVGVDQHEVAVRLSQHSAGPVRAVGAALVKLGTDRLARLPRQLLDGEPGASATFEQFTGKPRREFEMPAEAATELLVYRLQTMASLIGQLAGGHSVDADAVAFQASNDLDVLMSNERTRQRISRQDSRR